MKNEYPLRRKNKKKVMKVTWNYDSESELDDEINEEVGQQMLYGYR